MNTPDTLHYTKDHEWISIEDGIATVGVTDFAQSELGDIVYVEVETLDEQIGISRSFWNSRGCKDRFRSFYATFGYYYRIQRITRR